MDNEDFKLYFSKYDALDFVIAYGSVGRGEAPYIVDDCGKRILYNDLDLILVTENKSEIGMLLPEIKLDLKKKFGVKWVDILVWNDRQLTRKRNTVFYYDLCFKNLLIKGSPSLLKMKIKPFSQKKIKFYDFYCMYQTRIWAVMSLLVNEDGYFDKRFKSYQCSKVILAICDFALFSEDKYTPIVVDKYGCLGFISDNRVNEFLSEHLSNAVDVKLNPASCALDYFIQDESLVLELLKIYQYSFNMLIYKRSMIPFKFLFSIKMDLISMVKFLIYGDAKIIKRNSGRKKLCRIFFECFSSDYYPILDEREKIKLMELLKYLSE